MEKYKKIAQKQKINKLKIIAPTWNEEFKLPNGSYYVSDLQDCIEYCIKKHKTLTAISPINVHINRFVFKIEDGYKLELQTSETKKLFGSTKKIIHKTKN